MIYDHLSRIGSYRLPKEFTEAAAHFLTMDRDVECGKIHLSDNLSVNINAYNTIPLEKGRPEAHKRFIDIQIVLTGRERTGWYPENSLTICEEYCPERDIAFYQQSAVDGFSLLNLDPGFFMIFFPWDIHMPMIAREEPEAVKKLIYKIDASVF